MTRVLLLLIAAGAIVLGVTRLHHTDECSSASSAAFRIALGGDPADVAAVAHTIAAQCRGASSLAVAVSALRKAGRATAAVAVAEQAVHREPDNFATWVSLWLAEGPVNPTAANAARARAHELNPRYAATAG